MSKIFLICPVANISPELNGKIGKYVNSLENAGHKVHWPFRDTNQNDFIGGYNICKTNFKAILEADEIHIWYDEASSGSKFDMGGVFMLTEILGYKKRVIIVNDLDVHDRLPGKSFFKVFQVIDNNTRYTKIPIK